MGERFTGVQEVVNRQRNIAAAGDDLLEDVLDGEEEDLQALLPEFVLTFGES